jgi:purine-binding chemotaxis protein CheW
MNNTVVKEAGTATLQYLTFYLNEERYGIDVHKVREILEIQKITKIPQVSEFMLGVINVRGSVVPVIDLNLQLGLPGREQSVNSAIIICELWIEDNPLQIGVLVDQVDQVLDIKDNEIEPPPKMGNGINSDLLTGVGKEEESFILFLDIHKALTREDLDAIEKVSEN